MEALGILSGSIVHNLNNLLTAILGHTRLAMDDLDVKHPTQRNLEQILRASEAAGALTREILDFELRAEQDRQPQRLQGIVLETVKLLHDILPETVEIRTRLDQSCGPVLASPPQVQQLLLSLCSNAYHAMARYRGTISISLEDAEIDQTRDAVPQAAGTRHLRASLGTGRRPRHERRRHSRASSSPTSAAASRAAAPAWA